MAQEYEQRHWAGIAQKIVEGRSDLRWYAWKAERTVKRLRACGVELGADASIAEVGSGPVGQVGFLPGVDRVALDPLMDRFAEQAALVRDRPAGVRFVRSKGEHLPLDDRSCDLVVIDNCLDHCEDPGAVLGEIRRVLKPDGHLYLTLNVRPVAGWLLRELAERTARLDRGHPYSYSVARLRRAIAAASFAERSGWLQSFPSAVRENWKDGRLRTVAKVVTLTNERLYEGVWRCA